MKLRLSLLLALLAVIANAEVACPAIFGNGMVLQRDLPVPVWGTAASGEAVTVEFGGQKKTVRADSSGKWRVALDRLKASTEPRSLSVHGTNTLTFTDVLVGEVWFCSGQSNMEKPLGPRSGQKPTDDYEAELARADCPTLRLYQVPQRSKPKEGDGSLQWFASNGEGLMKTKFSAAAYYFGRELVKELGVPVGLIHSSFGGTRIEAWMPPEAFAGDPLLRDLPGQTYQAWVKGVQATELYQSMVAPFVPYALRGFLWYQGEANCMNAEADIYARKMRAMISTWRAAWGLRKAPFYFAQLAPFAYSKQKNWEKQLTPLALPALWQAQIAALDVPQTGIIPTSDLAGNGKDIHPTNKRDVGLRFARLALLEIYDMGASGPIAPRFLGISPTYPGRSVMVSFRNGDGLRSNDGKPLNHFEIAGDDRQFHPAKADIQRGHLYVSSPEVARPVAVRFAWDELAMPNLVNAAGLPALPFRTDDWPMVLEVPKEPKP
ncbi:MAG TPA: sialate O-acetylesterase [Lacunisphaera sp.]|nr:sialate O-acetylesterase [Lacunisphaera sp.]